MTTTTKQSTFNKTLTKELALFNSDSITDNMKSVFSELLTDYDKGDILDLATRLLEYDNDNIDEAFDNISEVAENYVDIYNYDLVKWLADDYNRAYIIDEAIDIFGCSKDGILGDIKTGQYHHYYECLTAIVDAIDEKMGA